jgi:hypothetical protein
VAATVVVVTAGMTTKILHITHPQFDFNSINKKSLLLCDTSTKISESEYHTSLGDLDSDAIVLMAKNFDLVRLHDELFDTVSDIYNETVFTLNRIKRFCTVDNFESKLDTFLDDETVFVKPNEPTLWVFGCSHSYGVGLNPGEMRYGDIMAQELNLRPKIVAKPGSSLQWSFRHLVNAEFGKDDLVVWQITMPTRTSVYDGVQVNEVMFSRTLSKSLLDVYTDDQCYFTQLTLIRAGVRYLRARQIKFVLTSYEPVPDPLYRNQYIQYPEYCYTPDFVVDRGNDNGHFGPVSHKRLALALLDHVKSINV